MHPLLLLRRLAPPALLAALVTARPWTCSPGPRAFASLEAPVTAAPAANPQGVQNRFWEWRGQRIRYQAVGPEEGPAVLLVHGLFVNADHWRRNLQELADAGFRAYTIDMLGYGYSSKPPPCGEAAQRLNGESTRDLGEPEAELGTAEGGRRTARVPLRHPLGSAYNFYTWSEQLRDFTKEVVRRDRVTLIANSIGCISSLQAAVDEPSLFGGILAVNPNFRELHAAEMPAGLGPLVSAVQWALREYGQPLFDALANPGTVKQILREPYHDPEQVTDELVEVLLRPLLMEGSADVLFDSLSYSAGPLPEQLLADPALKVPVWVCYGEEDPWTPNARVRSLDRFAPVERVVPVRGAGHCPHDEAPGIVNPLIVEFARRVSG